MLAVILATDYVLRRPQHPRSDRMGHVRGTLRRYAAVDTGAAEAGDYPYLVLDLGNGAEVMLTAGEARRVTRERGEP